MTPEEYEILFGEPPPDDAMVAPRAEANEPVEIASMSPSREELLWMQVEYRDAQAKRSTQVRLLRRRVLIPAALIGAIFLASTLTGGSGTSTVALDETNAATATTSTVTPATVTPTTTTADGSTSTVAETTIAPTTTTTIPTEVLGAVEDRELATVFTQLTEADVVAAFTGFPDYDRDSYTGGGWPDSDGDCQSDRHEVLIEESLDEPVLDAAGCRVISGRWIDPYDGTEYTSADDVTIDHVVPLAAAHQAGAWAWTDDEKRSFATDTEFPATLAAVGATVNQSKGSSGPEQWRPPLETAWCRYAVDWISIKARWDLALTESEVIALSEMLDTCNPLAEIDISGSQPTNDDDAGIPTTEAPPPTN